MREKSRIARLRELAGLSQIKAAELSGVSRRTIQAWEGYDTGTAENIEALLETYFRRIGKDMTKEAIG